MAASFVLSIYELPSADCLNYENNVSFRKRCVQHILNDCDSVVDLIFDGKNVLNGYEGAFSYPTHPLLMNMNDSVDALIKDGQATIPIYLQSYSFHEGSPQHRLYVKVGSQAGELIVSFEWYSLIAKPPGLPVVYDVAVSSNVFMSEIERNVTNYRENLNRLASLFPGRLEGLAEEIMGAFRPLPFTR